MLGDKDENRFRSDYTDTQIVGTPEHIWWQELIIYEILAF